MTQNMAYEILDKIGSTQILTYEKAEKMFSAMKPPFSLNFALWFKYNKEEIMRTPEIYLKLPYIHNKFETSILKEQSTLTRLKNRRLSGQDVLKIYNKSQKNEYNTRPGNEELEYQAAAVDMSSDRYDIAQDIFEITKKRERSYIPQLEADGKRYRGRILRADDPMNILEGDATDCCQRVDDEGQGSMEHGATENTGRIFVIEEIDENGNVGEIVAQSWVWRNNDTLCFDNIEIPESLLGSLKGGRSEEDISRQIEILEIYRNCAKQAIEKDKRLFDKLLKQGKITQEQYGELRLRNVTIGTGLGDLGILEKSGLEKVALKDRVLPKEIDKKYHGKKPWIDSGGQDGEQLYLARDESQRGIKKGHQLEEISVDIMYRNKRYVEELKGERIDKKIGVIKRIEGTVYRESQKLMQGVLTFEDIGQIYGIEPEKLTAYVSADEDWYMIYEEREDEIYIADLAMINGVNSEGKGTRQTETIVQELEVLEKIYSLMERAAQEGKRLRFEATEDTSYKNILNLVERGIVEIEEDDRRKWRKREEFYEYGYEEYDEEEQDESQEEIMMHDMVIKIKAPEKIKSELERIRKHQKRRIENDVTR